MSTTDSTSMPDKSFIYKVISFTAAGLGTGWIPLAPGTWGSLLGVALTYFIGTSVFVVTALTLFAWLIIHLFERKATGHDHSSTVIDEVAGISWSLFALPLNLPVLVAAFLLFRFFDILKPFPISWADRSVPGAFGTLLDDLMAGAVTCGILHLALHWGWL